MIKMTIHHGEEVQQRDLPCDFLSLRMSLYQMNLMRHPDEVSVRDVQAEFTSTDPIGQKLISLIRPGDLLSDVDVAIHQLKAAPQAIQEAMRQKLMDGTFETIEDIHIGRDQLLEEKCGFRQLYYFPLACSIPDEDGNGKPDCPLIGQDSNIFNLVGIASRTLREHGLADQAQEMRSRITQCQSYDSALAIIGDYVNITSSDDQGEDFDEGMRFSKSE